MIDKLKGIYKAHEQIINYLIVGVLTTLVSWTAKFICAFTILDASIPWQNMVLSLINWTAGVTFAYFTNRRFVFKSKESNQIKEATKFVASRISTYIFDTVFMLVMVNVLGFDFTICTLISAVIVTIINYIFSKMFVFKEE